MSDQAGINRWVKAVSREKKKVKALEGMVVRLSDLNYELRKAVRIHLDEEPTQRSRQILMEAIMEGIYD